MPAAAIIFATPHAFIDTLMPLFSLRRFITPLLFSYATLPFSRRRYYDTPCYMPLILLLLPFVSLSPLLRRHYYFLMIIFHAFATPHFDIDYYYFACFHTDFRHCMFSALLLRLMLRRCFSLRDAIFQRYAFIAADAPYFAYAFAMRRHYALFFAVVVSCCFCR